jgi:hypothetical protein
MALAHGRTFSPGSLMLILCLGLLAQGCAAGPSQVKSPSQQVKVDPGQVPPPETLRIDVVSRPLADMPELPLEFVVLRSGAVKAAGRPGKVADPTGRFGKPADGAAPGVPVEIAMVARVKGLSVTPGKGGAGGDSAPRVAASDAIGRVTVDFASFLRELPEAPTEIEIRATIQGPPVSSQTVTLDAAMCARLYQPLEEERAGDRAFAEGKGLIALDRYSKAFELNVDPKRKKDLWGKIVKVTRALPIKPALPEEVRRMLVQADALAKRDEGAKALPLLEKAKRKAPWFPPVHYNLAMMNAMNKDFGGAIASMTAYLEIAPDAPDARQAKDKIYEWETSLPAPGTGPAASPSDVRTERMRGRR